MFIDFFRRIYYKRLYLFNIMIENEPLNSSGPQVMLKSTEHGISNAHKVKNALK